MTEAAASGVLVAGTKVGLLYDLGDSCGVAVETGDFENLSKLVLNVIQEPTAWEAKVGKARTWSQFHDFEWTIAELNKILAALIK